MNIMTSSLIAKYLKDVQDSDTRGISFVDPQARFVETNSMFDTILGYGKGELNGKNFIEILHPNKDLQELAAPYGLYHFQRCKDLPVELKLLGKSGNAVPVRFRSQIVRDSNSALLGAIGIFEDLRRRKPDILQRIWETEENLRNILGNSGDAIVVADSNGNITMANETLLAMLDYTREEIIGMHIMQLSPFSGTHFTTDGECINLTDEYVAFQVKKAAELYEKGKVTYDMYYQCKYGHLIPVESTISLLRNQSGELRGSVIVARDTTERRKADREHQRLVAAMEQTAEGVFITDVNGFIEYANPSFAGITGYDEEEIIGKHIRFLNSGQQGISYIEEMLTEITAGRIWKGQFIICRQDGSPCTTEVTITPLKNSHGTASSFVSIMRDITETVNLEKQLHHSQKMKAIGTLAGGIAHDFNNILTAIIGYTEMTTKIIADNPSAQDHLAQVLKAADRARELIKQILTFSRQNKQERKPVQVKLIVKESLKLLRASLPTTIEMRYNLDSEALILADLTQIQQMLMNLCTNASHAMRETGGGLLKIGLVETLIETEADTKLTSLKPGPYVRLTVQDSGCGIDPSIVDHIFDPFFTTKNEGEGTGMGLALVHGIVQSHEGSIRVESRVNEGTTFHVLLPIISGTAEQKKETVQALPTGTETVLFVDDEQQLMQVFPEMLESLGYSVVSTSSSLEALDLFRKGPDTYDLVITDHTMPRLTGYDLAEKLLDIRPGLPIILCTGFNEALTPEKLKLSGIREFVMKPLHIHELAEMVRRVLDAPSAKK